jgi:hypothetical protein
MITYLSGLGISAIKVAQGSRVLGVPADRTLGASGSGSGNNQWGHVDEILAASPQIYTHWLGHNDLPAYTGADATAKATNFFNNTLIFFRYLKAALPGLKIIWIIPTNATSAYSSYVITNDALTALRPLIRGNTGSDYDAFADFGAQPEFVDNLATQLSGDGLHVSGGSASTLLFNVLQAVVDPYLFNYGGRIPAQFSLGADITNVATATDQFVDVLVSGLAPGQSLVSATATNGSVKQGFGSYGSSIGAGALFNGDLVRLKATSSASNSTLTTHAVTLQPGAVTDDKAYTTAAASTRSPLTSFVTSSESHPTWVTVSNGGKTATSPTDVGGAAFIGTNQPIIAGRRVYWEMTLDVKATSGQPTMSMTDQSGSHDTDIPGNTAIPNGVSYRRDGVVYANGGLKFRNASNATFPLYAQGDTVGMFAMDNGNGTFTVWPVDKTGTPITRDTEGWTPFSVGGYTITAAALYPATGLKLDQMTANWTGPFLWYSSAALAAMSCYAVDAA